MVKKRKLLFLLGASTALAVGTLFTISSINGGIFESNEKSKTDGEFSMEFKADSHIPTIGEDGWYHYQVGLSDGVNHVGVKLKGVEVSTNEKNPGIFVNPGKYAFIANEAEEPIRGISRLDFNLSPYAQYSTQNYLYSIYFSYNPINMSDVLAGRYQDLKTYIGVNSVFNDNQHFWNVGSTDARYFLAVIANPGNPIRLDNMTVTTPCADEPATVPVGTYPDSFNIEDIPAAVPTLGNGSFAIDEDGPETGTEISSSLISLQANGGREAYYNKLLTNGYAKVGELPMYTVYQKLSHDDLYYTVLDFGEDYNFDGYTCFRFTYVGELKAFVESASWPKSELDNVFDDTDFKALLVDPEMPSGGTYVFSSEEDMGYVSFSYPSNTTIETYQAAYQKMKDYGDYFVSQGYQDYTSTGGVIPSSPYVTTLSYSKSVISPDLTHTVDLYFYYRKVIDSMTSEVTSENFYCSFTFHETELTAFPSAELASIFGANMIPDMNVPGALFAKQAISDYDESIEHQAVYFSKTITREDVEAYFTSLGDDWTMMYEGIYIKIYGDSIIPHAIQIMISERTDLWFELYFASGVYSRTTNSFYDAVEMATSYSSYEAAIALEEAAGFDVKATTYYVDIPSGSGYSPIYCKGFGQEELDALMACTDSTPELGANNHFFVYNTTFWLIRASIVSDSSDQYLMISIENVDITFLLAVMSRTNNEMFNNTVDTQFRQYQSDFTDEELATFHLNEEGTYYYFNNGNVMVITDSSETTNSIRNSFISQLESDSHIVFSEYRQAYFQVDRAISVVYSEVSSQMGMYYFTINLMTGQPYEDYLTYSELLPGMASFLNLDKFPSLEKEGRHYLLNYCDSSTVAINVDDGFADQYEEAVIADGFSYNEDSHTYMKVNSAGDVAVVIVQRDENGAFLTFVYQAEYFTTIEDVASQCEYLAPFVLPTDEGKLFHLGTNYSDYIEIDFASINRANYIAQIEAANFTLEESGSDTLIFYKYVDQDRFNIFLDVDRIIFRSYHFYQLFNFSSLSEYIVDNGFDNRRLDRLPEISSDKLFLGSFSSSYLGIQIVDPNFDISSLYETILAMECNYIDREISSNYAYFVSEDSKTTIEFNYEYGVYTLHYRDNRRFYVDMDTVLNTVKEAGMSNYRLSFFVRPTQSGALYIISDTHEYGFTLYISEQFDSEAYMNQLLDSGFERRGDSYEFYLINQKEVTIYVYPNYEIRYQCYLTDLYTFDDTMEYTHNHFGVSEDVLANFVGPDEDFYYYSPSCSTYSKSIELRLANSSKVDFETYGAKLLSNGYELVNSDDNYREFRKGGYNINVYEDLIYLRFPYSYDEAIDKIVNEGFDSKELDKFVVPNQSNLEIESPYSSAPHQFTFICGNLDVAAYELQLEDAGYVLDTEHSSEITHCFYKGHNQIMVVYNGVYVSIDFSSAYSFSDVLNYVSVSDEIKYAFSGPYQSVEYNNQYYGYDRGFTCCYYDDTFNLEDYIAQLVDEGYVLNINASNPTGGIYVYEKKNFVVSIDTGTQTFEFRTKWTYQEIVECAINNGFDEDKIDSFVNPEQDVYYDEAYFNYNSFSFVYDDSFNESNYSAKLMSDERYKCIDDGSLSGVYKFLNGTALIEFSPDNNHITFTTLYSSEDAITLLQDYMIPGKMDDFIFPENTVYTTVYVYTRTRILLEYYEHSFDLDSYVAVLENNGYTLVNSSDEDYVYSNGEAAIQISTAESYIYYVNDMSESDLMNYLNTIYSECAYTLDSFIGLPGVSYADVYINNYNYANFYVYFETSEDLNYEEYADLLIAAGYEEVGHDTYNWFFRKGDVSITVYVDENIIHYIYEGKY